jgi:hypothetical protein
MLTQAFKLFGYVDLYSDGDAAVTVFQFSRKVKNALGQRSIKALPGSPVKFNLKGDSSPVNKNYEIEDTRCSGPTRSLRESFPENKVFDLCDREIECPLSTSLVDEILRVYNSYNLV